jgi:hypothetical protein
MIAACAMSLSCSTTGDRRTFCWKGASNRSPTSQSCIGPRGDRGLASTKAITPPQWAASFGLRGSSILVCHLPKPAKQMLIVEFADLEIGSAAERYRSSVAKNLPKPLCPLYCGGRARAVNGFTRSNAATIIEIEWQCHEKSDFGHVFALCKFSSWSLREASP